MVAAAVRANAARRVAVVVAEGGVGIAVSGEGAGEAAAARVFLAGGVPARGADAEELIVAVGMSSERTKIVFPSAVRSEPT